MKLVANEVAREGQKFERVPTDVHKPTGAERVCIETHFSHWLALALMSALEENGFVHRSCWNGEPTKITQVFLGCLNKGLGRIRVSFKIRMNSQYIWCSRSSDLPEQMIH